jgi:hypothetical protein
LRLSHRQEESTSFFEEEAETLDYIEPSGAKNRSALSFQNIFLRAARLSKVFLVLFTKKNAYFLESIPNPHPNNSRAK